MCLVVQLSSSAMMIKRSRAHQVLQHLEAIQLHLQRLLGLGQSLTILDALKGWKTGEL